MEILKNADSDRECENHLVLLLGYDCFEFIKILLKNRDMITYCIRLKMAQSDSEERDKIVAEMKKRSQLRRILNQLEGEDEADAEHVATSDKYKAKNGQSQDHESSEANAAAASWDTLNLEEMAFANGSHFMANKRCQLPDGSYRYSRETYFIHSSWLW